MSCTFSEFDVKEGGSGVFSFTLNDEAGDPVALAALDSITLTLYNLANETIINSRNAQDVMNANQGTFHATSGLFSWASVPDDHPILATGSPQTEVHIAHVRFVWDSGAKAYSHQFRITVCNIKTFAVS